MRVAGADDGVAVMLETWLRESRVQLSALVMLETWPRESGVPRI